MPRPRTIAIGDVHGCSMALARLLRALKPQADDTIVPLGDYVDRGPDSKGVIDLLIDLEGRCQLVPILGNHDQMMLAAIDGEPPFDWFDCGGMAALKSYGSKRDLGVIPAEHADFLRRCRDFHETPTHIFGHANYYPDIAMEEQDVGMLRWESLREYRPGPHQSGKRVVLGHSSQKTGEILDLGHLVCIDTFCFGGGWLTALDVESGRVWQADRDGRLR